MCTLVHVRRIEVSGNRVTEQTRLSTKGNVGVRSETAEDSMRGLRSRCRLDEVTALI